MLRVEKEKVQSIVSSGWITNIYKDVKDIKEEIRKDETPKEEVSVFEKNSKRFIQCVIV